MKKTRTRRVGSGYYSDMTYVEYRIVKVLVLLALAFAWGVYLELNGIDPNQEQEENEPPEH